MLKTKSDIIKWLHEYHIENYTINDDLTVDVDNDVNLSDKNLYEILIQFGVINGNFWCNHNKLTSFQGCPVEVRGDFYCFGNKITNFKDCPRIIEGDFNCMNNHLNSISDLNSTILGFFIHSYYCTEPYEIKEIHNYYHISAINKNAISVHISGKDLESIICEQDLQKNLPINKNNDVKKLKI
jgi:hypothetical protein